MQSIHDSCHKTWRACSAATVGGFLLFQLVANLFVFSFSSFGQTFRLAPCSITVLNFLTNPSLTVPLASLQGNLQRVVVFPSPPGKETVFNRPFKVLSFVRTVPPPFRVDIDPAASSLSCRPTERLERRAFSLTLWCAPFRFSPVSGSASFLSADLPPSFCVGTTRYHFPPAWPAL